MRKLLSAIAVTLLVASTAFAADTATAPIKGEYGNNCAWGVTQGKTVHTDCSVNWVDTTTHKTYCFSTQEAKASWAKDTKASITKADAEYPKVATTTTTGHAVN